MDTVAAAVVSAVEDLADAIEMYAAAVVQNSLRVLSPEEHEKIQNLGRTANRVRHQMEVFGA